MDVLSSGINVLLIVIGFGLLICIHELGHFAAAKWAGIRTHSFAIGFGPPIFSWRRGVGLCWGSSEAVIVKRCGRGAIQMSDRELEEEGLGETEYSLRWLPLGGFVRMLGQDDLDPTRGGGPRSFGSATIGRRMVVISAGVVMNVLLAMGCFILAFAVGVPFEAPVIGEVLPGSPANRAAAVSSSVGQGLLPGDTIRSIGGDTVNTFVDVQVATAMAIPGASLQVEVDRPGVGEPLWFAVEPEQSPATGMLGIGVYPAASLELVDANQLPQISELLDQWGLAAQGVGPGWSLREIDGQPVSNWGELDRATRGAGDAPLTTSWTHAGESVQVRLEPQPEWEALRYPDATEETVIGWEEGIEGFVPLVRISSVPSGSVNEGVLQEGDVILACGGVVAPRRRTVRELILSAPHSQIAARVLRAGRPVDVDINITRTGLTKRVAKAGVFLGYAWETPILATPMDAVGTAEGGSDPTMASRIPDGVLPGSRWVAVDGSRITNWTDVWAAIRRAARSGQEALAVVLENPTPGREHRHVSLSLTGPEMARLAELQWQPRTPAFCFLPEYVTLSSGGNPLRALEMGATETWRFIELTYLTIDRLIRGSVGVDQLHGPVGIVHLGSKVADRGMTYLVFFLGIISVNLAVLNFLPLPIVDGGMFLYLIYEKITGHPPSVGFQNAALLFGLLFIGTAFFVTFYNDLARLLG
ncbi:MAG: site-2 protease family protein [Phycisphaerales bacterium]|jgi:regulator of sigma E protease|nr:site-2 protease family protein [Phycisphaerales bacterium]